MKPDPAARRLCVERHNGLGDAGVWWIAAAEGEHLVEPGAGTWGPLAEHCFAADPNVASLSIVTRDDPRLPRAWRPTTGVTRRADAPALPRCFLSGLVVDLIGVPLDGSSMKVSQVEFERWCEIATHKGLAHLWWVVEARTDVGSPGHDERRTVSGASHSWPDGHRPAFETSRSAALSVGIDAAWLLEGESGAQVFVVEMLKELARRDEVSRIALISESGDVPATLAGIPKVESTSWQAVDACEAPYVDVLHRPYQPTADMDYGRYRRAGRCVALTVLDFIAYDNPSYHESTWAWRRHRAHFDEHVCLADGVFAISDYVSARLEEQYGAQLHEPVRSMRLGTDHLTAAQAAATASVGTAVGALAHERFVLVLGNDFEHKNRDFAVRVFAEMCDRGYEGKLVLAGFHLDLGSSYGHELQGAGSYSPRVVRLGAVAALEKAWLLRRAGVVLYPTSAEGFGLIPFESASLGTPVAFVRFGPLKETMPGVDACEGWQVRPFADLVFRLMADPGRQVAQVRAAAAELTWAAHVERLLDGYRRLLSAHAAWRTRRPRLPGAHLRAYRQLDALAYRLARRAARLASWNPDAARTTRTS